MQNFLVNNHLKKPNLNKNKLAFKVNKTFEKLNSKRFQSKLTI